MTFIVSSTSLENLLTLEAISFYRKHVSPLKGYKCAASYLGCSSCSSMAMRLFKRFSFSKALTLLLQQFKRCGEAGNIISILQSSKADPQSFAITLDFNKPEHQKISLLTQSLTAAARGFGINIGGGSGGSSGGGNNDGNNRPCPCTEQDSPLPIKPCLDYIFKIIPCSNRFNPIAGASSGSGGYAKCLDSLNPF